MGTSLDIKIKRANKVYHAGVSGVGGPAGFVGSRTPLTLGVSGRPRGRLPYRDAPDGAALCSGSCRLRVRNRDCSPICLNARVPGLSCD